jgi:hypothetical protein
LIFLPSIFKIAVKFHQHQSITWTFHFHRSSH